MQTPNGDVTLSSLRDERQRSSTLRRSARSSHGQDLASHEAIRGLLEAELIRAGLDFEKFRPLIDQSNAEARQRAAQIIAEAQREPGARDSLRRIVDKVYTRAEQLEHLSGVTGHHILLETADEISSFGIAPPIHERRGPRPWGNSSRFTFDKTYDDSGFIFGLAGVGFGFAWQNPTDSAALVNVDAWLVLSGGLRALTNGGFIVIQSAQLSVDARLHIHELWNDPPTAPIQQQSQSQNAMSISCQTTGVVEPGNIAGGQLSTSVDLQYSQLVIPPRGIAMVEVACEISYDIAGNVGGEVQASFYQDPDQVLCPGVLLTRIPSTST